ncbi:hypothetical protein AB4Z22_25535 [Paenibacillus sp. TAF58]
MKQVIRADADFQNCIYFQSNVEESIGGELEDIGIVQEYLVRMFVGLFVVKL